MNNIIESYFPNEIVERALSLQAQSYQFLLWMADLERNAVSDAADHEPSQLQDASFDWIEKNYEAIPNHARPSRDDLRAFSNLFATYLESSFDLIESPGQRLYSEDAHCFCPLCSWLVDIPNLQPKKLTPFDKRRAKKIQREFLSQLASTMDIHSDSACERVLTDSSLREDIALSTWMDQLLHRLEGVSPGPAVLALWRSFAWTSTGAPKKNFRVSPELVRDSTLRLQTALGECPFPKFT